MRAVRMVVVLVGDAYASLTAKPTRTLALVFGIALGVATLVGAVTLADTQQVKVDRAFDAQRATVVVVAGDDVPPAGFSPEGRRQLVDLPVVSGVGEVSVWVSNSPISGPGEPPGKGVPVVVADSSGLEVVGARVSAGEAFDSPSGEGRDPAVWLGAGAAERLDIDLDRDVRIVVGSRSYRVAGLVDAPEAYAYLDQSVVMHRPIAVEAFGRGSNVRLLVGVRPGSAAEVAAFALPALDPGRKMLLQDATPPDAQLLPEQVGADIRTLGLGLGIGVGVVGLVGVANTLAMTVAYRMRELGLRSALGWSRRRISGLVFLESVLAGALASVVGAALGLLSITAWCLVQGIDLVVEPGWILIAVVGGVVAAAAGGVVPALQAGSVSPMEALRG